MDSAYYLLVNGQVVGYNQGSRNAAEFDISNAIVDGPTKVNTLRVVVYQWSDGSYIEDQDMWWLSGTSTKLVRVLMLTALVKVFSEMCFL